MITGASRGIGLETAKMLSSGTSPFDTVVMVGRASAHFEAAVDSVRAAAGNRRVLAAPTDLEEPSQVDALFDFLNAQDIKLTTIVNNAGMTIPASINESTLADFERTMRVNVYSPYRIIQASLHLNHPLEQIVNIASTAGITGRAGWLTYSVSKAAMVNMSEVLREELAPYDIDVICLSPGRCATDLRRKLAPDEDPTTIMQPEQVAEVIALMISPTGKLLKSHNLVVRT